MSDRLLSGFGASVPKILKEKGVELVSFATDLKELYEFIMEVSC
jgi:hypothetical protein